MPAQPEPLARLEVAAPLSGLPDPQVLSAGGRGFAALGERCGALAAELRQGGRALSQGRGGWSGVAAEAGRRRAERLAAALDLAAAAGSDAAAVLVALAAAVTDALAAREAAERLAAAAGWELTANALAGGGDPATAARVAALARQAAERSAAALAAAAAGFAEIAGRARAACALAEREGEWAGAVGRRLHGPVPLWADLREGLADGVRELVAGTAQAAALGSPLYWTLRPRQAWRQGRQALAGGLAALQHPGQAVSAALGAEDLGNGHAARFWARLAPQAALAVAAKGAALAREAAAAGEASRLPLAEVNPGYPGQGRLTNCANCAVATDATLAGRPACALPGGATSIRVLEAHYGRSFSYRSSPARIVAALQRAGPGARGIVFASRGTRRPGHLFNVVNLDGDVRFLDGQRGGPAAVEGEGYVAFFLLRTD